MRLGSLLLALIAASAASCAAPAVSSAPNAPASPRLPYQTVDIRELSRNSGQFIGQTLTVSGILHRSNLYADIDAFYQLPQVPGGENGAVLGLDLPGTVIDEQGFRSATFRGRLVACATSLQRRYQEANAKVPENALLLWEVTCGADPSKPMLIVDAYHVSGPAPVVRQLPVRSGPGYGSLAPVPNDWKPLPVAQEWADRFISSLQSGDTGSMATLHDGYSPRARMEGLEAFLLKDPNSPFSDIRQQTGAPQRRFLVRRQLLESPDNEVRLERDPASWICFCRGLDCTDVWPIALSDADNRSSRPYACTEVVTEGGPLGLDRIYLRTPNPVGAIYSMPEPVR